MPAALKVLASSQLVTTNSTTVYTVPGSKSAKIASCSITNKSSSAVVVSAGVIPAGGTADGTHDVIYNFTLGALDAISHKDVLSMLDGVLMEAGAQIVMKAGTGAVLNYLVTGAEIS